MMLASLIFGLFVGFAVAEYGWKPGTQYNYRVRGRTVTGLNQVTNQFTGVLMKAKLNIQAKSDSTLSLQITGAKYAEIHSNLSNGWDTYIPDESLDYAELSLHNGPFELYLDDSIIKEMIVDQSIPTWELNILKSIASLLQLDLQAENVMKSRMNMFPNSDSSFGVYKTMEDSINGVYETIYDIAEIQPYSLLSQPELLPLPHLVGKGKVIEIVKSRNFSNSDQHVVYHSGIGSQTNWKPGTNHMGNFLTRSSTSQIIVSGNVKQYTIQSSTTTDKIIVAPHLYNEQRGMVGSRFNLTLESVNSIKLPFPVVNNPRPIRNLVYEYNSPKTNEIGKQMRERFSKYNFETSTSGMKHKFSSYSYSSSSKESEYMNSEELNYLSTSKLSEASPMNYVTFTSGMKNGQDVLNSTQNIIRLAQEIGQGIVSSNVMTGEQTLNKFSLLIRLIRTVSTEQLREISEILYYPYMKTKRTNSLDVARNYQAWISFRDAVVQSGTGPALMNIKEWITSKKIAGEEASHIITSLSETAKYPTTDYIEYFFDMLNDEIINNHASLRASAVISFTELVRKALVDKKTSQNNYPVHMFESVKTRNDSTMVEKYVTYLQMRLQESVEQKKSINIQLYIRALNNIAHPYILKVFKPYLEGKMTVSKFQRFTIIASMDKIVKLYPNLARSVLFRIYNNMADIPEIRIAAVMQLMKTNPPVLVLQKMAQQTNFDLNKQVNAAVKSGIESYAKQEINKYNKEMVLKARAAVNMLTPENYGLHHSRNFINSYIVKERNLAYKHHLAYIQSADSIYPSSFFYNLKNNIGGYKHSAHEINYMISSISKLIDSYDGLFGRSDMKQKRENNINSKWSLNNIYNSLNFEKEEDEQLEGHILATILGAKRYIPFDNNIIQDIQNRIAEIVLESAMSNSRFNFTKLYNQYSMEVVFPTAMGFPFIYTLETPTLFNFGVQLKGLMTLIGNHFTNQSEDLNIAGNYNLLYSTHKEGKIGFITPYNGKMYTSGLEKNIHVHIPIKMNVILSSKKSKISATFEPVEKNVTQKLFEFSTWAFTGVQDSSNIDSLTTRRNVILVQNDPIRVVQQTFGKEKYGLSFDMKMETDKNNLNLNHIYNHLKGHDIVSLASFFDMLDEVNNNNVSVTFDPQSSWSEHMELSVLYNSTGNTQKGVPQSSDKTDTHKGPSLENEESYRKELLKNVAVNIKDAQTKSLQLKMGFKGLYETEYELILAYSDSYKSNLSRIIAFMKNSTTTHMEPKTYLGALEVTTIMPRIPLSVSHEISSNIPPTKVKGRLVFGEKPPYKSQIMLDGDLYTSQERRDYLRKHPLVSLCEKQIQMGYKLQAACRNVTRRMNYLDKYQLKINYEQIPNDLKDMAYKIYRYINNLWYDYNTETINFMKKRDNIDIEVKFGKSLLSSNLSITTPDFTDKYVNVPIHEWVRPLVVLHPQYSMIERLGHKIMIAQESPTCTYDKDQITSFDNSTYYVNLGDGYYILTQHISNKNNYEENKNEFFSIIAGQHSENLLDLRIIVGDDVLEITQNGDESSLNFIYNGKKFVISNENIELRDISDNVILKLYPLLEGAVKLVAEKHGFEIIHYGNHIIIEVRNKFRNKLRGLCGNFDGELYNEFTTPQNCIASNREQFIASYGFNDKTVEGVKLYPKAQNTKCYMHKYLFGTVVNEEEVNKYIEKRKMNNHEESLKKRLLKKMIEASSNAI